MLLKIMRVLAAPFFWIIYPLKIYNKEKYCKRKRQLLVMNHLSWMDPVLILKGLSLDVRFMGKKELVTNRFRRWFFRNVNMIMVDRDNVSMDTMRECLAVLRQDRTLGIYPEGTRNRVDTNLQELKEGVALFALMGRAPLVPVAIHEKARLFHRSHLLIGETFDLSEFYGVKPDKEILAAATARIRTEMEKTMAALDEIMARKSKKRKRIED